MSTTRALEMCNRYVLKPFHVFLKVVSVPGGLSVVVMIVIVVVCLNNTMSSVTYIITMCKCTLLVINFNTHSVCEVNVVKCLL